MCSVCSVQRPCFCFHFLFELLFVVDLFDVHDAWWVWVWGCSADMALEKKQAERIKDGAKLKLGHDKRNLYLANEGLIVDSGKVK